MATPAISEVDLHAYADGQLDGVRRSEVEAYLAAHPEAAARVGDYRLQMQLLHAGFDGIMNEPVPMRLTQALHTWSLPRGLAASVLWLACGLAAGWFAHDVAPNTALTSSAKAPAAFAKNALAAHVLYTAERRHPVEVGADQEAHLIAWLSRRLKAPVRAPNLQSQGFSLLGGRLLPGNDAPLAQLMYQSENGERLTLTVRHAVQSQRETGFKVIEEGGVSVFYWIDHDYGYALSGGIGKSRLLAIAHEVDTELRR